MKRSKLAVLMSLLLMAMMILAACGGGDDTPTDGDASTGDDAAMTEDDGAMTEDDGAATEDDGAATEDDGAMSGDKQVITVASGAVGAELELAQNAAAMFEEMHPDVEIRLLDSPDLADDRLGLYLQYFETQSSEVDVYQIDTIWPGDLAEHLIDLGPALEEYGETYNISRDDFFPAMVENNTVDGALVALPWFTDAGLLYYRTDLMEKYGYDAPPATWDELTEMAQTIQDGEREEGNQDFSGYVWQGNAYEGLTCDALEWIASFGGGTIVSPEGVITINNDNAVAALETAAGWVGTISPDGVVGMAEEDARSTWQAGNAAFMRNWPYAYSLGNADDSAVAGLFDVSPLPAGPGGSPAAALGGWQLAVSKYSQNPDLASEVAVFLAGPEVQKMRAIDGSLNPTIEALYEDADVLEANPFFGSLFDVFANAVARPSTATAPNYAETSRIFFTNVHEVLTGDTDAQTAVENIELDLEDLTGFEVGQP